MPHHNDNAEPHAIMDLVESNTQLTEEIRLLHEVITCLTGNVQTLIKVTKSKGERKWTSGLTQKKQSLQNSQKS